jgi:hypothetical protein
VTLKELIVVTGTIGRVKELAHGLRPRYFLPFACLSGPPVGNVSRVDRPWRSRSPAVRAPIIHAARPALAKASDPAICLINYSLDYLIACILEIIDGKSRRAPRSEDTDEPEAHRMNARPL